MYVLYAGAGAISCRHWHIPFEALRFMRIWVRRQRETGRELPFRKEGFHTQKERKAVAPSRFLPHARASKLGREQKKTEEKNM